MGRPAVSTEKPQTPNARRLIEAASELYGPNWQRSAAKALGINTMAINRFVRQGADPSDELVDEMLRIAHQRGRKLLTL